MSRWTWPWPGRSADGCGATVRGVLVLVCVLGAVAAAGGGVRGASAAPDAGLAPGGGLAWAPARGGTVEVLREVASGRVIALRPTGSGRLPGPGRDAAFEPSPYQSRGSIAALPVKRDLGSLVSQDRARAIARAFLRANGDLLGPVDELVVSETTVDRGTHIRYEQEIDGVAVVGAGAVVHLDRRGSVRLATVSLVAAAPVARTPVALTTASAAKPAAVEAALGSAAGRALVRDRAMVAGDDGGGAPLLVAGPARRVYLPLDEGDETAAPRLAWEVGVEDRFGGEVFSVRVYLDAVTGELLRMRSNISRLDRWIYDCTYDPQNGGVPCGLNDLDPVFVPPYYHGRTEGMPVRGPYPDSTDAVHFGQTDVDDAYDYTLSAHNLAMTYFGINGANNQGGTGTGGNPPSSTRVAVFLEGQWPSNCPYGAFFNFGSGGLNFCNEVATPDTYGHEYAHALSFFAVGAVNGFNETGALSEAFSDLYGEAVENDLTGSNDWFLPTGLTPPRPRNIEDPGSIIWEVSGLPYPVRYFDPNFYCGSGDNGGEHGNSLVISHAFYLFAVGGEQNGCDIGARGLDTGLKIFRRAWDLYLTGNSNFNGAYTALNTACGDLYAADVCADLTSALQAAQIDQAGHCSGQPEAAPACAVHHAGTAVVAHASLVADTLYAPGETLWLVGSGGVAGTSVDVHVVGRTPALGAWDPIVSPSPVTVAVDSGGSTQSPVGPAPTTAGEYDLVVDGNQDGFYQPWADEVLPFTIPAVTGVGPDGAVPGTGIQRIWPNPAVANVHIAFSLAQAGEVELAIYDVRGRRVRTVVGRGVLASGAYARLWDGRTESGRRASAGVYFARLTANHEVVTRKVVRLR